MTTETPEMLLILKLVRTLTDHLKILNKQAESIKQLKDMLEAQGAGQLILISLLLANDTQRRLYFTQEIERFISQSDFSKNPYLKELLQEYLKLAKSPSSPDTPTKPQWFQGVIQGSKSVEHPEGES